MSAARYLRRGVASAVLTTLVLASLAAADRKPAPSAAANARFESRVRPLFLASCVNCHNKETPQGGLRLDAPVPLEKAREVLRRVKGEGGKPRMPLGSQLPHTKIADLEQWVRDGSPWPAGQSVPIASLADKGRLHWAFKPVSSPRVPVVKRTAWVHNPIDAFILSKLEARALPPSPPAARRDLIRRVTYDLTGLPPTPEEVAAFQSDRAPGAYAKLVDRLLASPHYGEKWGRHWLDLVRYAETNSYERDNPKPYVTKYRDYVIRAFNEDKPYDRFIREQLAGDEMPDGIGDPVVATAYYRLGIWDDEPADMQQALFDDLDDLVATTGQAFLGLTLDCARCHDHKLDPIPQKDYYRFASFFRNINRFHNGGPTDEAAYFATAEQKKEFDLKVADLEARRKTAQAGIDRIEAAFRGRRPQALGNGDIAELTYRYYEGSWDKLPDFNGLKPVVSGQPGSNLVSTQVRKKDNHYGLVYEGALVVPKEGDYSFTLYSEEGVRLTIAGKSIIDKPTTGGQAAEQKAAVHLPAGRTPIRIDMFATKPETGLYVSWSGPDFSRRSLSSLESCSVASRPAVLSAEIPLILGAATAAEFATLSQTLVDLQKQQPTMEKALCVTEAGAKAPDMYVLKRGDPTTPGDKVEPAFPLCAGGGPAIATPPMGGRSTGRRTALANWIASPSNPLTARVIVNRIWQHHFGRGIVRTPNDFGLQGAKPSHPELIDWLAREFIRQGWSIKKLHRMILTSNTYMQSSSANPAGLARDPQNDLFWRFDSRRLGAEEVRDSVLAVCGNINLQMYGDCIYPDIPKEILAGQSIPGADWYTQKMKPEDLNRRSIYIHVKRSLIYPLLAGFDLPETDRSVPTRFASTQPTQALGMINGPFANRQASVLAERVRKETGSDNGAFSRRVLSLVLQRSPDKFEIQEGIALMKRLGGRGASEEQARSYFCLMALNLSEFFYLD